MQENTLKNYLATLVSHRTVSSDQAANNKSLDYLEAFFRDRGLYIQRYSFNGHGALVATTINGSKTPKVMLAAHLDVVPGPDELFTLREEDGKYFGRGVFDMKMAIASYMHVLDTVQDDLHAYDLGIMITTEEEIGGLEGVRRLIEIGYRPTVCVLPDGASNWQVETFAKGIIYGRVITRGKSAHGSMPWEGDSATIKLIGFLSDLKAHFLDQTLDTNTLNVGMLSGGDAINQIPAEATASLDIRFLSMEDRERIINKIDFLCDKYDTTFEETPLYGNPCVNELTHPLIKPFVDSITAVTGREVSGTISYGASDARFFATIDVPCIITRPDGGGQHSDHEWVDKKGYEQYPYVLIDYLNKVARTQ